MPAPRPAASGQPGVPSTSCRGPRSTSGRWRAVWLPMLQMAPSLALRSSGMWRRLVLLRACAPAASLAAGRRQLFAARWMRQAWQVAAAATALWHGMAWWPCTPRSSMPTIFAPAPAWCSAGLTSAWHMQTLAAALSGRSVKRCGMQKRRAICLEEWQKRCGVVEVAERLQDACNSFSCAPLYALACA